MARKSKAEYEAELLAKVEEIERKTQDRLLQMIPSMVSSITSAVMQQVGGTQAPSPSGGGDISNASVVQNLAVEMARLGDPGGSRRYVSAEVRQARAEAKGRMMDLLEEARAAGEMPIYEVINKTFLGNQRIEPEQQDASTKRMVPVEINWPAVPNLAMKPVNEIAQRIHHEYLQSIGSNGMVPQGPNTWVLTGNVIRQRNQQEQVQQVGNPGGYQTVIRDHPAARQAKRIAVLGTLAPPVVENV